ncbi:hypothetical protein LZ190_07770 [Rhodovulum sulfidophilum]|nr:hypothetical protein [Rhodovulum sulfidophilum]
MTAQEGLDFASGPARDFRGGPGRHRPALPFRRPDRQDQSPAAASRPAPDNAIEAPARALRLPPEVGALWHIELDAPSDLAPRIV